MKLFIIPSWYPSEAFPTTGIFLKEQVRILDGERPDWSIGVSLWGSHEPKLWLKASRPLHSLIQYASRFPVKPFEAQLEINLAEFFTPAYTWSRKLFNGNIRGIVEANKRNFERYRLVYGQPDVIHAHVAYPAGYIAMQLSRDYHIPYVVTEHMSPFPLPNFQTDFKKYVLPPLQNADAVLSVGNNLSGELQKYGIPSIATPNFVDLDRFKVKKPENNVPVIFTLGRLVDQKGFDLLLKALEPHVSKSWQLKIGGSGPLKSKLEKMARKFGLEDRLKWPGELPQSEVVREMQSCDFFVLPSRHESFGIVLIEAMACGKPVIYTRCGGVTNSLPDAVGMACDISVGALSEAVGQMLAGYQEYDSSQIRKYVEDHFSVAEISTRLEGIYRSVMKRS